MVEAGIVASKRGEVRWLRRGKFSEHAGEVPRDLCYRLCMLCEKRKRVPDAVRYHACVQSWSEVARLAREGDSAVLGKQRSADVAVLPRAGCLRGPAPRLVGGVSVGVCGATAVSFAPDG